MTSPSPTALEKLKSQHATLTARIQKMEARNKASERKKDLQRKILVGAYYLDQMKKHSDEETIPKAMDSYLTRSSDRALFGLGEKEKPFE